MMKRTKKAANAKDKSQNMRNELIANDEALCLLVKAKDIVAERWVRGRLGVARGKVCSLGAIGDAYSKNPRIWRNTLPAEHPAHIAACELAEAVRPTHVPTPDTVIGWNDASGRTNAEVVAGFGRAIQNRIKKLEAGK